ncbi:iron chelate uptake ABC transporter family permease subunit [Bacillus sp. AGMB 02131]|uniref:Iron chelate uptake ABC transporter family permease subunit n=1 Tax=Peribacillus faecalis TaxID=2772559 RepID=A0A927HB81_9BACI|nr:iron chelate uptake ABC transporter family permease subunit [Peribacillus faecalis]MBD3108714.1 iron chelate uptake ABC transporter family permease subunit [Peribacillus faecalis]
MAKNVVTFITLISLFICSLVMATMYGGVTIPFKETVKVLLSLLPFVQFDYNPMYETILVQIRFARVIVAGLIGAALAISGVVMQSVFRNPMADPGIIGVSSGGAFGGVIAIYFGFASIHAVFVPLLGFVMALITLMIVYAISTSHGKTSMMTLLLTGIAVSSFLSSCSSLLISFSNAGVMQQIVQWLMGNLNGRDWGDVQILIVPIMLSIGLFMYYANDLDIFLLGEEQAQNMGITVQRTRNILLIVASLVTGISVAMTGAIGFVGLIVPHMIRMIIGPAHRYLLLASAFGGASFLIIADLISRIAIRPAEIQIGIVTAFFGAPFFIYLIMKYKKQGEL